MQQVESDYVAELAVVYHSGNKNMRQTVSFFVPLVISEVTFCVFKDPCDSGIAQEVVFLLVQLLECFVHSMNESNSPIEYAGTLLKFIKLCISEIL